MNIADGAITLHADAIRCTTKIERPDMTGDDYMKAWKEGAVDKKAKISRLLESWDWPYEWNAVELKRAVLKIIENEKLP